jgi:hypothetical protein
MPSPGPTPALSIALSPKGFSSVRQAAVALALTTGILAPAVTAIGAEGASPSVGVDRYPPGLGVRLVDAPTSLIDDPRAHVYIIDRLAPGTVISRRVQVSNGSHRPIRVSLYAGAATIGGGLFKPTKGYGQDAVSSWTSTSPSTLLLAGEHAAYVHVTIRVPPDAAPGERYGVVWAQTKVPPASPGGPVQVSRVGIRLYLSIGSGGAPASDFRIVSMTASRTSSGVPMVHASIRNTGGRALDLTGSLTLTKGPGGLSAGPFAVTLGTTLGIHQTEPVSIALDKQIPDGPWLATLTATSDTTRHSARATLTFPSAPGTGAAVPASAVHNSTGSGMLFWMGIAGILLTLVMLFWYVWRRRRGEREPASAGTPSAGPEVTS